MIVLDSFMRNTMLQHFIKESMKKSLLIESAQKVSINNEMFLTNLPISPTERELWYNFIEYFTINRE